MQDMFLENLTLRLVKATPVYTGLSYIHLVLSSVEVQGSCKFCFEITQFFVPFYFFNLFVNNL